MIPLHFESLESVTLENVTNRQSDLHRLISTYCDPTGFAFMLST